MDYCRVEKRLGRCKVPVVSKGRLLDTSVLKQANVGDTFLSP